MVKSQSLATVFKNMSPWRRQHSDQDAFEYSSSDDEDDFSDSRLFGCLKDCLRPDTPDMSFSLFERNDDATECSTPAASPSKSVQKAEHPLSVVSFSIEDLDGDLIKDPPIIKRSVELDGDMEDFPSPSWKGVVSNDIKRSVEDADDSEEFPLLSWGAVSNDFFLYYDMEDDTNCILPEIRYVDSVASFHTAWDTSDEEDDDTVVVSNRKDGVKSETSKIEEKKEFHERLRDVFQITLSSPLQLPKQKSALSFKQLIRSPSRQNRQLQSHRSVDAARSRASLGDRMCFKDTQENILYGSPLQSEQNSDRSPRRLGSLLKRSDSVINKASSPAKKLETLMNKKNGRQRTNSDPIPRIRQMLARKKDSDLDLQSKTDKWSEMDDAVRGRHDGVDVISCGSARKVSYIGRNEKNLAGQRYV